MDVFLSGGSHIDVFNPLDLPAMLGFFVCQVTKAVLILVEKEYKNHAWDRAKKMMNNVDQFKNR